MRYIIRFHDKLSDSQQDILNKLSLDIIYQSKFLPLIGVITDEPEEIRGLDFVKSIREPAVGSFMEGEFYTTITFEPPLHKSLLVKNQMFGWGDIRVAIIDSGVNSDVSVTESKDFTGTGNFDVINHGTRIASIIKHFAKGCNLYSAKIGNNEPDELNMLKAIEWAVEKGVNIINISSGFKRNCNSDCELCQLISQISKFGVAVVVAAGNEHNMEDTIYCPGRVDDAVTVGAIDRNMKLASYSSIGKPGSGKPNILAPGNGYINDSRFEGTSFAAPVISGILAAILYKSGNVYKAIEYIYRT
ncbi:MAG: S8 family serine peptidase, partial [Clostridiaceae bacterium]|nr:S8 family serine peptidase [Clostridiaceae bacterium]